MQVFIHSFIHCHSRTSAGGYIYTLRTSSLGNRITFSGWGYEEIDWSCLLRTRKLAFPCRPLSGGGVCIGRDGGQGDCGHALMGSGGTLISYGKVARGSGPSLRTKGLQCGRSLVIALHKSPLYSTIVGLHVVSCRGGLHKCERGCVSESVSPCRVWRYTLNSIISFTL